MVNEGGDEGESAESQEGKGEGGAGELKLFSAERSDAEKNEQEDGSGKDDEIFIAGDLVGKARREKNDEK